MFEKNRDKNRKIEIYEDGVINRVDFLPDVIYMHGGDSRSPSVIPRL